MEQADALFQIATERMQLRHQALEQRGVILDAQVGANQLLSELVAAEGRFEEAQELASVWGGSGVRNPQNYRPVVLKKQIDAAERTRGKNPPRGMSRSATSGIRASGRSSRVTTSSAIS